MFRFKSKIENEVLRYFFINQNQRAYINELARTLDLDPGNLSRKLKEFEEEGILNSEFLGKQKYYFLNKKYPLIKEIKKAFSMKNGLPDLIASEMQKIKKIKQVFIFGSYAKGKFNDKSDIDVLIIGNHSLSEVSKAIMKIEKKIKREINTVDMTEAEFKKRKKDKDEFVEDIFSEKIIKII
jgi:hypothetical protein